MSLPCAVRAYITSRQAFANTSLIVRCLSTEAGRLTLMAKGASRPKNPFQGQIDLFYLVDLVYLPSRSSDMHTLKEIRMIEPYLGLRRSYASLLTAHYFTALIEAVTEEGTPLPQEYELLAKALTYLGATETSWRAIDRFEQRILALAGVGEDQADLTRAFSALHLKVPRQREELRKLLAQNKPERS